MISLPEELFIESLTYLLDDTLDIIRTAQVCKRWRKVIHGRKELWQTLVFLCKSGEKQHLRRQDEKLEFYRARVHGGSLKDLTVGSAKPTPGLRKTYRKPMQSYREAAVNRLVQTGMVSALTTLWTSNFQGKGALYKLLQSSSQTLRHYAFTFPPQFALPAYIDPLLLISICPSLVSICINPSHRHRYHSEPAGIAQSIAGGGTQYAATKAPLRRLHVQVQHRTQLASLDLGNRAYEQLECIHLESTRLDIPYHLPNLRALSLIGGDSLLTVALGDDTLGFDKLETLKLRMGVYSVNHIDRLRMVQSPHLRKFELDTCGARCTQLPAVFSEFVARHPLLEELRVPNASSDFFTQALPLLHNLLRLSLIRCDFSRNFFGEAALHLLKLRYLDISQCRWVDDAALLRFVEAKSGELEELGAVGCSLEKETVALLREKVKDVRWSPRRNSLGSSIGRPRMMPIYSSGEDED